MRGNPEAGPAVDVPGVDVDLAADDLAADDLAGDHPAADNLAADNLAADDVDPEVEAAIDRFLAGLTVPPTDLTDLTELDDLIDVADGPSEPAAAGAGLDATPPGALLASLLAATDLDRCTDDQIVAAAVAAARLASWAAARKLSAAAALVARAAGWRGVARDGQSVPGRTVAASRIAAHELGAALDLSPRSAGNLVHLALDLARLPVTRAALAGGEIDLPKARMVADALRVLDDDAARDVEDRVLPRATGRTWAQLHDTLRRAVLRVDPASAAERRRRSVADRTAERFPLVDGMAGITWTHTAETIDSFWTWLTGTAEAARGTGDHRTLDQVRADVLGDLGRLGLDDDTTHPDLLHGTDDARCAAHTHDEQAQETQGQETHGQDELGCDEPADGGQAEDAQGLAEACHDQHSDDERREDEPGHDEPGSEPAVTSTPAGPTGRGRPRRLPVRHGRRPHIQVVVGAGTLLGLDDDPAELVGYGPITADVARRIAADGTWQRVLTDPRTGRFDEMSAATYEPPQDLRDHVVARDRTCRGPGCRMAADRTDLDHRVPHPRGPTSPDNLYAACRPFHEDKTLTDTTVTDDGAGGLRVTYPSGRTYHRPADPVLDDPLDGLGADHRADARAKDRTDGRARTRTGPGAGAPATTATDDPLDIPPY